MFVPLSHPPGHAQADFGEADAIIAGVKYRAHFFVMTLPHSDACFVAAYPAATTEAWLDGHNRAFAFFGGVPQSILYDNDKCLVSRILSDGTRQRTRSFSGLQSHYLFEDRTGRPGKGNDKGNVEGVVGYARRNFMTPLPRFASWDAFGLPPFYVPVPMLVLARFLGRADPGCSPSIAKAGSVRLGTMVCGAGGV